MRYGLSLRWQRCPDGVEVYERPPVTSTSEYVGILSPPAPKRPARAERWFRYRSKELFPFRHELTDLREPLVLKFRNARSTPELEEFFSEVGLPGSFTTRAPMGPAMPSLPELETKVSMAVTTRRMMDNLLVAWHSNNSRGVELLNQTMVQIPEWRLMPRLEKRRGDTTPTPTLTLEPPNLYAFMLMELALMFAGGGVLVVCDHCGAMIVTGSNTGKRGHSKYCGDKCRVAAMRARQRAALNASP